MPAILYAKWWEAGDKEFNSIISDDNHCTSIIDFPFYHKPIYHRNEGQRHFFLHTVVERFRTKLHESTWQVLKLITINLETEIRHTQYTLETWLIRKEKKNLQIVRLNVHNFTHLFLSSYPFCGRMY